MRVPVLTSFMVISPLGWVRPAILNKSLSSSRKRNKKQLVLCYCPFPAHLILLSSCPSLCDLKAARAPLSPSLSGWDGVREEEAGRM